MGCSECQAGDGSKQDWGSLTHGAEYTQGKGGALAYRTHTRQLEPGRSSSCGRSHSVPRPTVTQVQAGTWERSNRRHHHRLSFLEHAMFQPSEQSSPSLLPTVSLAAGVTAARKPPHSGFTQLHLSLSQVPRPSVLERLKPAGRGLRSVSDQTSSPRPPLLGGSTSLSPSRLRPRHLAPLPEASAPGLPSGGKASVLCPRPGTRCCSVFILDRVAFPPPSPAQGSVSFQRGLIWNYGLHRRQSSDGSSWSRVALRQYPMSSRHLNTDTGTPPHERV